jgi:ABC-2 type transport system permease protein
MKARHLREKLRIIGAITIKDVLDALRNKQTLGVILPTLAIVLFYRAIPQFVSVSGLSAPTVLLYDEGNSSLVEALEASEALEVYAYGSQAIMEEKLASGGDKNELGLVIPVGFDEMLDTDAPLALSGYALHWVTEAQANVMKELVEEEVERWAGKPIEVELEGNIVYSRPDSFGFPVWGSLSVIYVVFMIGVTLTPHLMLEEKQNKSMDALLVSPASSSDVVIGKALAGLFYCLMGAGIALALNTVLVTHWGLAILAVIFGSVLAVALGLLLGCTFEIKQQLTVWTMPIFAVLLIPVFLAILPQLIPELLLKIFSWIPTVAMERVVRTSFSGNVVLSQVAPQLVLITVYALLLLTLVVRVLRRSDR